ncbi:putative ribonuclease H-like domain-containing protein [Tanacetum coccineum]
MELMMSKGNMTLFEAARNQCLAESCYLTLFWAAEALVLLVYVPNWEDIIDAGDSEKEDESAQDCFVLPIWPSYSSTISPDLKTDEKIEEGREFAQDTEELGSYSRDAAKASEMKHKKISEALEDESWVDAMQDELLQIEAIRIFLAFASYMGFIVYQMDVKSAFLYGKIDEEVYVSQPPDEFQWKSPYLLVFQVKRRKDGNLISQVNMLQKFLKKFDFANVKTASTPIETQKPLVKDEEASYMVTPRILHLSAVKRIFSNLTWNRTTGGCQFMEGTHFLHAKKQTLLATSTKEAEYFAVCNYCGKVLWIPKSTIYIIPQQSILLLGTTFHKRCYEKKLIQVLKIHTDDNVADLLTKALMIASPKAQHFSYLEKTEGNAEFHEIIDFLKRNSIHHALTVSPVVSTTFVEQFWTSANTTTPSPAPTSEVPIEPQTESSPAHTSEVPIEQQTDPSPRPSPSNIIPDSIPESSGGNLRGHSSSDKSLSGNEGEMTL